VQLLAANRPNGETGRFAEHQKQVQVALFLSPPPPVFRSVLPAPPPPPPPPRRRRPFIFLLLAALLVQAVDPSTSRHQRLQLPLLGQVTRCT
jgi:hypothetical protein